MRLPAWLALAPAVHLAGCAGIWGFEDLTVGDGGIADATAPRTEASVDASGLPGADAAENDATQDAAPVTDEAQAGDSATYEGGPDTGSCEPTSSILNCSACGRACDTVHSLGATCNGTTCAYVGCAAGWADCNATSPDTDGCETPGSCGGGTDAGQDSGPYADANADARTCQSVHSNGAGQIFVDCAPPGTYDHQQAQEACAAYNQGPCAAQTASCGDAGSAGDAVCACAAAGAAACWGYSGTYVGLVFSPVVHGKPGTCSACPTTPPAIWN